MVYATPASQDNICILYYIILQYIIYIYTYEIDTFDINMYILRGCSTVCFVDSFGPRTSYRTRQGCLKRNLKNHQKKHGVSS